MNSGLCADISQNSTQPGWGRRHPVAVRRSPNQRWTATPEDGGYTLTARSSGLLLTAASTTGGASLTHRPATSGAIQTWTFTGVS